MNAPELWTKACEHLKSVLNGDVYSRWIENIKPASIHDNRLILHVDNEFCQTWLENNYQDVIVEALRAAGVPQDFSLRFDIQACDPVAPETAAPDASAPKPDLKQAHPAKRRHKPVVNGNGSPLNTTFTFENFVTGPSNSFAHAAALGVSQSRERLQSAFHLRPKRLSASPPDAGCRPSCAAVARTSVS
jgi:chromosomal replication initiator protein